MIETSQDRVTAPPVEGFGVAVRSAVFNLFFYVNLAVIAVCGLPTLFMGRRYVFRIAALWGRSSLWLVERICGLRFEFRGVENIPPGAIIVASAHQSMLETFALPIIFSDFSYVLKRELTWIPVFGWLLKSSQQIAINRSSGKSAIVQLIAASQKILKQNRALFIFPEGTRRPVGAPLQIRQGVIAVYEANAVPCAPVVLNTGLFWPRRKFLRRPGLTVIEFLPVIPPGLNREDFERRLVSDLDKGGRKLADEAVASNPALAEFLWTKPSSSSQAR